MSTQLENKTIFRLQNVEEPPIVNLILLVAFATMGAILITPGLPQIATFFRISSGAAQLTVTTFLLGYALGQLVYGPIANRLGRKPAFYIGIAIATLGSLFSILSQPFESFHLLIAGRFFEALGSSVGLVICFTIINDFYYPKEARKAIAFISLAFAIVPGVSIAFGGLLTQYLGWQSCFYALLGYGLFLIYPAMRLPETILTLDPCALRHRYIFKNYFAVLKERDLVCFSMIYGLSGACVYVFCSQGSFIGEHFLSLSPARYGLLALTPYFGTLLGSMVSIRMTHINSHNMLKIGFCLEALGTFVLLLSFLFNWISIVSFLLPVGILFVGHAMIVSNATILAMVKMKDKANSSAMMNFIGLVMSVAITFVLGLLNTASALAFPLTLVFILMSMALAYRWVNQKRPI